MTGPVDRRPAGMVWYAGYGSNLYAARFRCYLEGGVPTGLRRSTPGARDKTPPRDDRPVTIPHGLYFAGTSSWGGAPCFVDTAENPESPAYGRAYLITWEQFEDVVAQENGRAPTTALDLAPEDLRAGSSVRLGAGRYEYLLCLGGLDGFPLVTFTSPATMAEAELHAPSSGYLSVMIAGLRESHAMSDEAIVAYLGSAPGCTEELARSALASLEENEG
jgi:hypothetical protein